MGWTTFSTNLRKSFPIVCSVCGVVPLDVLASHSTSHPVYMMYPQKGHKNKLHKIICLENVKINMDWILPYVLYDSVDVLIMNGWLSINTHCFKFL